MQVTFLGTGTSQGVPLIGCNCAVCTSPDPRDQRLRSSVHIEVNGKSIVIDSGPDFRQQMLVNKVHDLDALIFTHGHKDHIAGMDDIRAYNFIHKKAIDVYADERTQEVLRREFSYIFSDIKYPGIPEINLHSIANSEFEAAGVSIQPIEVLHYKLPVLGFRIHDFTYITDANYIAEEEREKIYGTKVLVLNALRHEKHISHFTMEEALKVVEELGSPMTYFTHISHQLGLQAEIEKDLPEHVRLGYDGLSISL